MFEIKYGYGTNVITRQKKSNNDFTLNFDDAEKKNIKLVEISEEQLINQRNCLKKNYTVTRDNELQFIIVFFLYV